MKKIIQYFKEVFQEFKQVSFPTKKDLFHYTKLLLLISFLIAFYLGFLDFFFSRIIQWILGFY